MKTSELHNHILKRDGFCTRCKDWTRTNQVGPLRVNTTGRDYRCPKCNRFTVIGATKAMMDCRLGPIENDLAD